MFAVACELNLTRRISGRTETIGEMLATERGSLRALPVERFDCAERSEIRVDSKGLACVRGSRYSVPIAHAGRCYRAHPQLQTLRRPERGCRDPVDRGVAEAA